MEGGGVVLSHIKLHERDSAIHITRSTIAAIHGSDVVRDRL